MTRDHYPHVHEPRRGVLICLGYNGRGVAMATAMGAQLARRITDPIVPFDMPVTDMKPIASIRSGRRRSRPPSSQTPERLSRPLSADQLSV